MPFAITEAPPQALRERATALAKRRGPLPAVETSRFAAAQDDLGMLVDAAVNVRRIEAMQQSVRVGIIHVAVQYALEHADAFTSPTLKPERRLEIARRSVVAEFATALRISERTMAVFVEEAGMLCTRLPETFGALRDGDIDYAHARVVIGATVDLEGDDPTVAKLDAALAGRARETNPATLRRVARRLREEFRSETLAERHAKALAECRVEFEPADDGMAWLHLLLEASDAALIHDRLNQVAGAARRLADPGVRTGDTPSLSSGDPRTFADDPRNREQLRADAARDLLLGGVPVAGAPFHCEAATVRPTVHVTVPVLTLLGVSDEPGNLDGYGPITPETARKLAAHAPSFTRLLTHPVDGVVLDVDRTVYRPPADLVKWLRVRDETCRFPGCNRRAAGCDIDHTEDFADGGSTSFDNLAHLCPGHHHLKHESSWQVRNIGDGVLEWRSPVGLRHRSHPPGRVAGPPGAGGRAPVPISGGPPISAHLDQNELPDLPPW